MMPSSREQDGHLQRLEKAAALPGHGGQALAQQGPAVDVARPARRAQENDNVAAGKRPQRAAVRDERSAVQEFPDAPRHHGGLQFCLVRAFLVGIGAAGKFQNTELRGRIALRRVIGALPQPRAVIVANFAHAGRHEVFKHMVHGVDHAAAERKFSRSSTRRGSPAARRRRRSAGACR